MSLVEMLMTGTKTLKYRIRIEASLAPAYILKLAFQSEQTLEGGLRYPAQIEAKKKQVRC